MNYRGWSEHGSRRANGIFCLFSNCCLIEKSFYLVYFLTLLKKMLSPLIFSFFPFLSVSFKIEMFFECIIKFLLLWMTLINAVDISVLIELKNYLQF